MFFAGASKGELGPEPPVYQKPSSSLSLPSRLELTQFQPQFPTHLVLGETSVHIAEVKSKSWAQQRRSYPTEEVQQNWFTMAQVRANSDKLNSSGRSLWDSPWFEPPVRSPVPLQSHSNEMALFAGVYMESCHFRLWFSPPPPPPASPLPPHYKKSGYAPDCKAYIFNGNEVFRWQEKTRLVTIGNKHENVSIMFCVENKTYGADFLALFHFIGCIT